MENEEDFYANKAEKEWEKQEEAEKKYAEHEHHLESLSDEDVDDLVEGDKQRKEQNRLIRQAMCKDEDFLKSWKESNPEETKIWEDKWSYECRIHAYSNCGGGTTEAGEWRKWITQRNSNAQEKIENLRLWNSFQKDKYEADIVDHFLIWSAIDEQNTIFEAFYNFTKWKEDHPEILSVYKGTFTDKWQDQDVYNFLSKGVGTYSLDKEANAFELWKRLNLATWEKWKSENCDDWKIKIHELYIWTSWVQDHPNEWNKWAEAKLDWWREFRIRNKEDDMYFAWTQDHIGDRREFELWKLKNSKDWEMWRKELEDRIEIKNWNE